MEPLTVDTLAEALHEPKRLLLYLVLATLGPARTHALLEEALRIETAGGMLTKDGSRRRTPGGVFLHLAKQATPYKDRWRLFGSHADHPRPPRPSAPLPPTAEAIRLFNTTAPIGDATVKLTLIGRPDLAAIQARGTYVACRLQGPKPPSLPKGLPPVPAQTPITWLVVIALRQWNRVKDSLAAHADERLIIEGYPIVSGDQHIVLVQSCATTGQQREKRGAAQAQEAR